jgi:hypoxanthine-guanine phosphoribosyltransferase
MVKSFTQCQGGSGGMTVVTTVNLAGEPSGEADLQEARRHYVPYYRHGFLVTRGDEICLIRNMEGISDIYAWAFPHPDKLSFAVLDLDPAVVHEPALLSWRPCREWSFTAGRIDMVTATNGTPKGQWYKLANLVVAILSGNIQPTFELSLAISVLAEKTRTIIDPRYQSWLNDYYVTFPDRLAVIRAPAVNPRDFEVLFRAIRASTGATVPRWLGELLLVFDNEWEHYDAPHGVEVGPLVISEDQIRTGLAKFLDNFTPPTERLRVTGKLKSGKHFADLVEKSLRHQGFDVERLDVQTTWKGYLDSRLVSQLPDVLEPRYTIICDTMVATGQTTQLIAKELWNRGGVSDWMVLAPVSRERPRTHSAPKEHVFCCVPGIDWLVGYGSDALCHGAAVCRDVPFIFSLRPAGQGFRERLMKVEQFPYHCEDGS